MIKRFYFFIVLAACGYGLQAQHVIYSAQDSALTKLSTDYPQEHVFLQTDKTHYYAGETVWFKAWCLTDGNPSYLSQIVYVDLVDESGKVVQKKMYKLDSLSSTAGDFSIPETTQSGNYSINAYSLWMLNFPSFVFRKTIFIYASDYATKARPALSKDRDLNVIFFPEGGDLVMGVTNRLAFKITDRNGMPVKMNGVIEDQTGKKIADLITEHDGMGAAELTIGPGQIYKAYFPASNGKDRQSFRLPDSKDEGITLKIENSNPNRLFVLLNRAEKNKQLYRHLKVVAQVNYKIIYAINLDLDEGQMAATINKKNLPPGIIQVTVFNYDNLPLAERIAFIENYEVNRPEVAVEKKNLQSRGRNQLSFNITDAGLTSISCLVTSGEKGQGEPFPENIISSSLLTSHLQGYIHQPGYYFRDKSDLTLRHLDLLLMTQGWRRFTWEKILNNEFVKLTYPVESAISFRGSMYKSDRKEPVKEGRVSFIIKGADSTSILAEAITTDRGEFLLGGVNYMQNAMVAYMGTNKAKENLIVDVKLEPNYIDSLQRSANIPWVNYDTLTSLNDLNNPARQYLNKLLGDSTYKTLQGVTIRAKKISREDSLNKEYAGGPFLMGNTVDPTKLKNYTTIWQMIQASVPGVTVEGNPFDPTVSFNRFGGLGSETRDPSGSADGMEAAGNIVQQENGIAYFLNEVNVSKDIINNVIVEDIALIKILKNEAAVLGASQGAIAIYTKKGVSVGRSIFDKIYTKEEHAGYAVSKEFAPPAYVYDKDVQVNDNRYTLYWNGKIRPSKDGKYRFEFYNNDFAKKLRLLIQGIDAEGQLIYRESIIE